MGVPRYLLPSLGFQGKSVFPSPSFLSSTPSFHNPFTSFPSSLRDWLGEASQLSGHWSGHGFSLPFPLPYPPPPAPLNLFLCLSQCPGQSLASDPFQMSEPSLVCSDLKLQHPSCV